MPRSVAYETRYPLAPWLFSLSDLRPQGDPETVIERGEDEVSHGYVVYGVLGGPVVLCLRAVKGNGNDGGTIALSIEALYESPDAFNAPRVVDDGA